MAIPFFNTNEILNVNKNNDNHNISNTSSGQKERIDNSRKKRQNLRSVALYVDGAGENPKERKLMQMVKKLFDSSDDDDDDYNDNKSDTNPMQSSDNNNKPKENKLTQIGSSVDVHSDNNKDNNNASKEHEQMQQLFESSDDDDSDNNYDRKKRKEHQRIQELLESSDDDDWRISNNNRSNDPWRDAVMDAIIKLNDKNGSSLKDILRVMIPYKGRTINKKHITNVLKQANFRVFNGKYTLNKKWWGRRNRKSKENKKKKITTLAKIAKCILSLNERKGTSLPRIKKYFNVAEKREIWPRINKALQSGVKKRMFIQFKRKYKLASTVEEEVRQIISEINHSKNSINGIISLKEIEHKMDLCCFLPEKKAFIKKFMSEIRTQNGIRSIIVKVQNSGSRSKYCYRLNPSVIHGRGQTIPWPEERTKQSIRKCVIDLKEHATLAAIRYHLNAHEHEYASISNILRRRPFFKAGHCRNTIFCIKTKKRNRSNVSKVVPISSDEETCTDDEDDIF